VAASPNPKARIEYSGGSQGWRGDIATSRLVSDKLNALGFRLRYTSDQAVEMAVREVAREVFGGPA
jgi:UDP-glucose 4-epimerase